MSKFKLINIFDNVVIGCAIFLLIYAWLNFYIKDLWTTFILSLIFSSAVLFLFFYFINKKRNTISFNKKQEEEMEKTFLIFKLNNKEKKLNILNKILSLNHTTQIKNNNLYYTKENKKHLILIATQHDQIDNKILFNLISEENLEDIDALDIICTATSNDINKNFLKNIEINFITKKILFKDFFLKNNIFPENNNLNLEKAKFRFYDFLKILFIPQKAKNYFFCGSILIFSSLILPYNYYYIVVGSTLLLFGIICKIMPKFKD